MTIEAEIETETAAEVLATSPRAWPRYPAYRDSGVEWLGEIPAHWEVRRLKYLLSQRVTDGPHSTPEFVGEGVPFLSVDNLQNGEIVFEDCRYIQLGDHEEFRKKALPRRGDILLAKAASTGKVAQVKVDFEFSIWSPLALIRVDQQLAFSTFVELALKSTFMQAQIDTLCTSNTQKNISMDDIPTLVLPLPPLTQQRAIAAYLGRETTRIDALVAAKERMIALLLEKRAALISQAVTRGLDASAPLRDSGVSWLGEIPAHWKVKRLAMAADKITNGFVGPTRDIFVDEGIRYLQSLHIKNGEILFNKPYYVSEEWSNEHDKSILAEGDVLIVQTGDIGQVSAVSIKFVGCNCHALIIVRLKPGLGSGFYLSAFLRSDYGYNALRKAQTGALHPHLECGKVREIEILLPPLGEQEEIMLYLDRETGKLDRLIAKIREHIEKVKEYRAALIVAVVTGRIDVRASAPEGSA